MKKVILALSFLLVYGNAQAANVYQAVRFFPENYQMRDMGLIISGTLDGDWPIVGTDGSRATIVINRINHTMGELPQECANMIRETYLRNLSATTKLSVYLAVQNPQSVVQGGFYANSSDASIICSLSTSH